VGLGVITAIFGGHDPLRPLPTPHGFDEAVCVTDNPHLAADGWRVVVEPKSGRPRLAAKKAKMLPWQYLMSSSSVWIDGSVQIHDNRFSVFVREHLAAHDLVVWDHPEPRDCLYQEADYCQDWPKYADQPLRQQTAHYLEQGMPEHFGLYAAGCVGMRHTQAVKDFGWAWYDEQHRWSIQDQVSLPFLLWKKNKPFGIWEANELNNDMVTFHQHYKVD